VQQKTFERLLRAEVNISTAVVSSRCSLSRLGEQNRIIILGLLVDGREAMSGLARVFRGNRRGRLIIWALALDVMVLAQERKSGCQAGLITGTATHQLA
jgi:hypothetical protein